MHGAWVSSLLILTGCGDEAWQAKVYPASGTISINGAPPAGAVVTLNPTGNPIDVRNSKPAGVVGEDGSYRLTTYDPNDGAPVGEYALTIIWPWELTSGSSTDRLKSAYQDPAKSPRKVTISTGENKIPSIELVGVKIQKERPRAIEP
jgi:hypothetical protein